MLLHYYTILFDTPNHGVLVWFGVPNFVWCIFVRGLVYQISCRDCNAVYVGETGRSVRTRKREHTDAVKTFNTKKSALSQHVMDFDHRID